jgi:hypothetical protein
MLPATRIALCRHPFQTAITAISRELPAEYQEVVLAKLDGRPGPSPPGGRLAAIEGGMASDDEFDPLDGGDEDFGDDEED